MQVQIKSFSGVPLYIHDLLGPLIPLIALLRHDLPGERHSRLAVLLPKELQETIVVGPKARLTSHLVSMCNEP